MSRPREERKVIFYPKLFLKPISFQTILFPGEFTPNSTFTLMDLPKGRLLGNIIFWYIVAFFIFDFYYCILGNLWRFASGN